MNALAAFERHVHDKLDHATTVLVSFGGGLERWLARTTTGSKNRFCHGELLKQSDQYLRAKLWECYPDSDLQRHVADGGELDGHGDRCSDARHAASRIVCPDRCEWSERTHGRFCDDNWHARAAGNAWTPGTTRASRQHWTARTRRSGRAFGSNRSPRTGGAVRACRRAGTTGPCWSEHLGNCVIALVSGQHDGTQLSGGQQPVWYGIRRDLHVDRE